MNGKHSPGAMSPSGETVGATSIATVVLALLTALGLAAVAVIGVGQFTGQGNQSESSRSVPVQPPAPVTVTPPEPAKALPTASGLTRQTRPARGSIAPSQRVASPLPDAQSAGGSATRGSKEGAATASRTRNASKAPAPVAAAPSSARILSLGQPKAGHTWSGVRTGQSWSGVKKGQSWSGVKKGQSWSGVRAPVRKKPKQRAPVRRLQLATARQTTRFAATTPRKSTASTEKVSVATVTATSPSPQSASTQTPVPTRPSQTAAVAPADVKHPQKDKPVHVKKAAPASAGQAKSKQSDDSKAGKRK